jgi:hypothetical protein
MTSSPGGPVSRRVSGWPLTALLVGFPVLWLLGLSGVALQVAAVPMALQLLRRGRTRVPDGFGVWLLFLLCSAAGALVLGVDPAGTVPDSASSRLIGFAVRESGYLAATVLLLYVGNLSEDELPERRVLHGLSMLFSWTVLGGVLALVLPDASFRSPVELLLPHSMAAVPYVSHLVHPAFAQVQDFGGDPLPRPAAPFPYTNSWGFQIVLLSIWFGLRTARVGGRRRVTSLLVLATALVTVVCSVNRGAWLGLALAVVALCVSMARRGRAAPVLALLATLAMTAAVFLASPLGAVVDTRLANGNSDQVRAFTSQRAVHLALRSPVVGYGSTRSAVGSPSSIAVGKSADCPTCGNVPIGINGYVFTLLMSTGFVGTLLFFAFWVSQLRRSRGDPGGVATAARITLLVAALFGFFYDLEPLVPFLALGLLWRRRSAGEGRPG